eukprot:g4099.t1
MLAVVLLAGVVAVPSPTLRDAAGSRIFIGSAINYGYLTGSTAQPMTAADVANYSSTASAEFSIITAENALKSKQTEPAQGSFNFTQGDTLLQFATENDMALRGHNLVWVAHNPSWLVKAAPAMSSAQLEAVMKAHIDAVATHYKGKVYSWDVVNEGMVDVPKVHICSEWQCALKSSASSGEGVDWTRAGDGANATYVEKAFRYAHAADPAARLFFNEYAVHGETTKFDYMHMMLADLVARGVPVHGVGLQTHVQNAVPNKAWNETGFRNVLRRLTALGLEVHVSELNVPVNDPMYQGLDTAGKLAAQAQLYADVLRVCLEFPLCKSFELWGFTDAHNSYGAALPPPGAFLYDGAYAPKPARASLVAQLGAPTPPPTPPPAPTPAPAPQPTPTPAPGQCSAAFKQCSGQSWAGPTCCQPGCTCVAKNAYYGQCKPTQQGAGKCVP